MTETSQLHVVTNENNRTRACSAINQLPIDNKKWTVNIEPFRKNRSLAQNRLSFLWYESISKQTYQSIVEARRFCKWKFGVPILKQSSPEFNKTWERIANNLDYEQQLETMDYIEVTRLFKTAEFTSYLQEIELFYQSEDIVLPHPDDLYYNALGYKKR